MKNKVQKIFFLSMNILLSLLIFLLIIYVVFEKFYDSKVYPNVYLGSTKLSGLTLSQAESLINTKIDEFENRGVKIALGDREIVWHNFVYSLEPDLALQPVVFDSSATARNAYFIGRNGDLIDFFTKVKSLFFKTNINLEFTLDEEIFLSDIKENFSDLENPTQEAKLNFEVINNLSLADNNTENIILPQENNNQSEYIRFFIEDESYGQEIDYDKFLISFKNNLNFLENNDIKLNLITKEPIIKKNNSLGLELVANNFLELAPFSLKYGEKNSFEISDIELASWLTLTPQFNKEKLVGVEIGLNKEEVFSFFDEEIKSKINQEPILPKFDFRDNRVVSFEPGRDGQNLNYEESFLVINNNFLNRNLSETNLIVDITEIENISDVNDLGIREIIGTGHSNYAGSPANRRHNIRVGANKLHGLIIKPGEEFSLVKALGEVNKETGYLPELVIKGNKTTPEYGGGLCQIATTMFRTALATGLEITERRNHSYRVSYYEPAGTDATIYNPHPDLRFLNNTDSNILIQARFEGNNDIYFDFWGKSDGRVATTTYPVIYNIIRPGPTQIIETTDLAPGEKKCTESAHSGAEAYFDYTVTYNVGKENENKIEKRFYSKYVPWREVCLVGVKPVVVEEQIDNQDNSQGLENNN